VRPLVALESDDAQVSDTQVHLVALLILQEKRRVIQVSNFHTREMAEFHKGSMQTLLSRQWMQKDTFTQHATSKINAETLNLDSNQGKFYIETQQQSFVSSEYG
jgi:hypothetical protein